MAVSNVLGKGNYYPTGKCRPTKGVVYHELPPVFNPFHKLPTSDIVRQGEIPPDSLTQRKVIFTSGCLGRVLFQGFQCLLVR